MKKILLAIFLGFMGIAYSNNVTEVVGIIERANPEEMELFLRDAPSFNHEEKEIIEKALKDSRAAASLLILSQLKPLSHSRSWLLASVLGLAGLGMLSRDSSAFRSLGCGLVIVSLYCHLKNIYTCLTHKYSTDAISSVVEDLNKIDRLLFPEKAL